MTMEEALNRMKQENPCLMRDLGYSPIDCPQKYFYGCGCPTKKIKGETPKQRIRRYLNKYIGGKNVKETRPH